MSGRLRIAHYVNQFFAQMGGEDKAGVGPGAQAGAIGPGRALQNIVGDQAEVVGTVFCGDNYFAERPDQATEQVIAQLAACDADLLLAGPAFDSGRYGIACGAICRAAGQRLGLAAVAAMSKDNAGIPLYRKSVYIVDSGSSATGMVAALQRMAALGLKLARGGAPGRPEVDGYLPRGLKRNELAAKPPAERAVDMLLAKIAGAPFRSEISPPQFTPTKAAAPLGDLSSAVIALVTDGGLVPEGNPQKMEPGRPTRFTAIPIEGVRRLDPAEYDVVHSGYDTAQANRDPNRLVPLDTMRELEKEGVFGRLYEFIHSTGGAHAAMENAGRIGREIAGRLHAAGVQGVILTST